MTRGENAEEARGVVGRGRFSRGRERRDILEFARILSVEAASLSLEIERSIHLLETMEKIFESHYTRAGRFVKAISSHNMS